jgi:hypothetical protein
MAEARARERERKIQPRNFTGELLTNQKIEKSITDMSSSAEQAAKATGTNRQYVSDVNPTPRARGMAAINQRCKKRPKID